MAKRPDPAATKTRLHGRLAPEDAAALYECFLIDTVELASSIRGADPVVAIHPVEAVDYASAIAPGAGTLPQRGGDLGERLDHVLSSLLDDGYRQVIAIGSDSPNLPIEEIERAFELLDRPDIDAVLGPALDGGYYLIGATERPGPLVTDVEMSTETVLADTLAVADAHGLRVALLAPWYDVDVPDDLDRLVADLADPGADPSVARATRSFLATLPLRPTT